jgi:2,3-bisphosphoglycerate-dependent phosphoglycerate mutase
MPTRVYVVRHGETEWNASGRQQGHLDSPLTALGISQAHLLAKGLAKKKIDILYSSDMGRAVQTAEIIAATLSLPVHTEARLRERNLGILQGLTREEFEARYPEVARLFDARDPDYVLPEGESLRRSFDRCVACAEEIAAKNAGRNVLIVAHGGVLRGFFHKATDAPMAGPRRYSLFNASLNTFRISEREWSLDTWGEIAHLADTEALDDF